MNEKEKFIKQLKKLRRNEFYRYLVKIIFIAILLSINPILVFDKIQEKDWITVVFLSIAEMLFIVIIITIIKPAGELFRIRYSRIYQCINIPEKVTEIVIKTDRIIFELKEMEDEIIYIRESDFRSEIVETIRLVFGSGKIVMN